MENERTLSYLNDCLELDVSLGSELEKSSVFKRFQTLLKSEESFSRDFYPAHFTASAVVTNPKGDKVLLTHHRKLNKWLQVGGHAEGEADPYQTALREVQEETGLRNFQTAMHNGRPFCIDIDIHRIPAGKEPEHEHYDFRFLVISEESEPLSITEESHDLKWFSLDEAQQITTERSMHRQFEKLSSLRRTHSHIFDL